MSERPFMQLYVSDFIGDTLHLSTEQIGAYMLLLMAMWNAGGRLPNDDSKLARVVRMSVKKWRAISGDLMPFFDIDDGQISHNRLTKELQKSESKSQSRASAGAKGGSAKALKNKKAPIANAKANAVAKPCHSPDTREKETSNDVSKKSPRQWLEDVLSKATAEAVIEHRKRLRKPLTERAAELLAGKFARAPAECGLQPDQAADLMIERGWQAFEPSWASNAGASKPPVIEDETQWRKRLAHGRQYGRWSTREWGPMPGQPDCRAPPHLLEPGDGDGWNELERAA